MTDDLAFINSDEAKACQQAAPDAAHEQADQHEHSSEVSTTLSHEPVFAPPLGEGFWATVLSHLAVTLYGKPWK